MPPLRIPTRRLLQAWPFHRAAPSLEWTSRSGPPTASESSSAESGADGPPIVVNVALEDAFGAGLTWTGLPVGPDHRDRSAQARIAEPVVGEEEQRLHDEEEGGHRQGRDQPGEGRVGDDP